MMLFAGVLYKAKQPYAEQRSTHVLSCFRTCVTVHRYIVLTSFTVKVRTKHCISHSRTDTGCRTRAVPFPHVSQSLHPAWDCILLEPLSLGFRNPEPSRHTRPSPPLLPPTHPPNAMAVFIRNRPALFKIDTSNTRILRPFWTPVF